MIYLIQLDIVCILYRNFFQDYLLQKIDSEFYWARLAKMSSKTFLKCIEKVKLKALKYKEKVGCDAICVGHTHMPENYMDQYFNSGCWTEKPPTYLKIKNKHLFNPANFGIIFSVFILGDAWISPGQWGSSAIFLFALIRSSLTTNPPPIE